MNRLITNKSILLLLLILTLGSMTLYAADTPALQADTYAVLNKVQQDMEKFNYATAKQKLKLLLQNDLKTYDEAVTYQTLGYVENGLGDYEAAAIAFEKALEPGVLPEQVTHDLRYSAAQLFIHMEQAEKGLRYLNQWFANEDKPTADAHIVAASAYYQLEDYPQLIVHVEKALRLNSTPPMSWYQLLLAAYFETKDYHNAADLLEEIVVREPDNRDYWLQLAGVYQQLNQERKALAVYELAYEKGLLKTNEIEQLARSYLYHEMPYKAAVLLEKELAVGGVQATKANLILLADSWLLAQENEKAESVFREIVTKHNDAQIRMRLGQLYVETEQWQQAVDLLGVKLDGVDQELLARINLLLGISQFNINNVPSATNAFNRALSDKATKDQARWWLEYLGRQPDSG